MICGWLNLRAVYEVIHGFLTGQGVAAPTPALFRVNCIYEREIYFKKLAHVVMEAWLSPKSDWVSWQGRVAVQVQRQSAGKIPSCLREVSSIQAFN